VLAACCGTANAAPATYVLDPEHSFVWFEVRHFGTSTIRARLGPAVGSVTLDRAAGRGEVNLRIATASVDTGTPVFNARLRQGDLLGSDSDPEAFFVARSIRFSGDAVAEVRGEFTLRGTSQPLALRALRFACRATAEGSGDGGAGGEVCGGDFEGELLRSDFGMTFGLPLVGNRVGIAVFVEGVRR
jgi:polyisoprenoid-binding protein YceI